MDTIPQEEWETLTIIQKVDLASKQGCEPGFINQMDVQDLLRACGLSTEAHHGS
jgi:hypothetical protein